MAKNKAKTRRIVTKRFKFTTTGKVKRKYSRTSHLSQRESADTKNRKKGTVTVSKGFSKKIKKMVVRK